MKYISKHIMYTVRIFKTS